MEGAEFEIRIKDTNAILSTNPIIFLRIEYKCACFDHRPPKISDFIKVHRGTNGLIMTSDAIQAMVEDGVNPDCKHYFLEGFNRDSAIQFTVVFGS